MNDQSPTIGDLAAVFAMIPQLGRMKGDAIPRIGIGEMRRDEPIATVHPVETGTPLTDHASLVP